MSAPQATAPALSVPKPAPPYLPVVKFPPEAHDVPSYSSVRFVAFAPLTLPPVATAAVRIPNAAGSLLAVLKLPPAAHAII